MDETTLTDHLTLCGVEEKQADPTALYRLTSDEHRLYTQLRQDRWGIALGWNKSVSSGCMRGSE